MKARLLLWVLLFLYFRSNAQVYVTQSGAGLQNGSSWSNAYSNAGFRTALKTAAYGTTFWIAAGTYKTENNRDSSFKVPNGVKLFGGFPATGSPNFSNRDWNIYQTIFDGDLNNDDLTNIPLSQLISHYSRLDNSNHVLVLQATDSSTLIDGISIVNGNAINNNDFNGGALNTLDNSSVQFKNCTFKLNSSNFLGGAVSKTGSVGSLFFINCLFLRNFAERGGAIYCNSKTFFKNSTFNNNSAKNNGMGTATYLIGSSQFDSCFFNDNNVPSNACYNYLGQYNGWSFKKSNIYLLSSSILQYCFFDSSAILFEVTSNIDTFTIKNSIFNVSSFAQNLANGSTPTFSFNSCTFKKSNGTATTIKISFAKCLFDSNSYLNIISGTIDSCVFTNSKVNSCINISGNYNSCIIKNSSFLNNSISGYGAAIICSNPIGLLIDNCRFQNNTSVNGNGGAIYINSSKSFNSPFPIIRNSYFFNNKSNNLSGGAIHFNWFNITISNCVFDSNYCKSYGGAIFGAGIINITNTLFRNNKAKIGGILSLGNYSASPAIGNFTNNTFFNNATDSLGNIYIYPNATNGIARFYNNIFWGNKTNGVVKHMYTSNAKTTLQNNIIQTQTSSLGDSVTIINSINSYPIFKDSINIYGPDSIFMTADDGFNLASCSPAINAGDSNLLSTSIITDILGNNRIYGQNVDLGAYEYIGVKTPNTFPTIQISTIDTLVCKTNILHFKAIAINGGINPIFEWYRNRVLFLITNDSNLNVSGILLNESDTIQCRLRSSEKCALPTDTFSNKFVVHFNTPKIGFTINNANQCLYNNNFNFQDTSKAVSGGLTSLWQFGNGDTSILINPNITYNTANVYSVKLISTSNNGCKDSITKTITVNPKPNVGFTINNSTQCLTGNNFVFNDTSNINSGAITRTWYFGNGNTSTIINPNIAYDTAGSYAITLVVTSNIGCKDSVVKNIVVNSSPKVGSISGQQTVNSLTTPFSYKITPQSVHTYLWTLTNGNIISGQGTDSIAVQWNSVGLGKVIVRLTNSNNCSDTSGINVSILPTGINYLENNNLISIYPNPTDGIFTIDFGNLNENKTIFIFDVSGKLVNQFSTLKVKTEVNMHGFAKGIYFLNIQTSQGIVNTKIVLK